MNSVELTFGASHSLDQLNIGTFDMGAPVIDGVVQIGINPGVAEKTRILVASQADLVAVSRLDGQPLEVSITEFRSTVESNHLTYTEVILPVLDKPVDTVFFVKRALEGRTDTRRMWHIEAAVNEPPAKDPASRLANTIVSIAWQKGYLKR